MSFSKHSIFNPEWLDRTLSPEFSSWILPVTTNKYQASCTVCKKNFELSNMGRRAVTSHMKSATHVKRSTSGTGSHNIGFIFGSNRKSEQGDVSTSAAVANDDADRQKAGVVPLTSLEVPSTSVEVQSSSGIVQSTSGVSVGSSGSALKGSPQLVRLKHWTISWLGIQ